MYEISFAYCVKNKKHTCDMFRKSDKNSGKCKCSFEIIDTKFRANVKNVKM